MFQSVANTVKRLASDVDLSLMRGQQEEMITDHRSGVQTWLKGKVQASCQDATTLLTTMSNKVKALTSEVDLAQVKETCEQYKEKCEALLEASLPIVQAWLREKLGCLTIEVIQNDELMTHALGLVYQLLPAAVRMIVREERFVGFCLTHRDRLREQYAHADAPPLLPEECLPGDVS
jgi:hypothetical protein